MDENGSEKLDGMRFLDWPTKADGKAVHEGLQAMTLWTMQSGERIMRTLGLFRSQFTTLKVLHILQGTVAHRDIEISVQHLQR